jgi:hypothetical protein
VDLGFLVAACGGRAVTVLVIALAAAPAALAQMTRPAPPTAQAPTSRPLSRDEALWCEIQELDQPLPATEPFAEHLKKTLRRRKALLAKARLYLAAYPGGPRRDDVVRLELRTLFDIGTLSGGTYVPLCRRVNECLQHPPSELALHEAAYWGIYCRRLSRGATSRPSSAPVTAPDDELLAEYCNYVAQYPLSRYVPRMANVLFEAAARSGDRDTQRALTAQLRRNFPDHPVTALLAACLRRQEAIGRPFALAFETADGERIDTAAWEGSPVLIVVWAGFDSEARACVAQVEAFRRAHAELQVVGVNLDESDKQMSVACQELGLAWPQFNDGRGWANRFALEWGVREVPTVFLVGRQGRLVAVAGAADWREPVSAVLRK